MTLYIKLSTFVSEFRIFGAILLLYCFFLPKVLFCIFSVLFFVYVYCFVFCLCVCAGFVTTLACQDWTPINTLWIALNLNDLNRITIFHLLVNTESLSNEQHQTFRGTTTQTCQEIVMNAVYTSADININCHKLDLTRQHWKKIMYTFT